MTNTQTMIRHMHAINEFADRMGIKPSEVTDEAKAILCSDDWFYHEPESELWTGHEL